MNKSDKTEKRLDAIEARLQELRDHPKDGWDKFSTVSTFLSGIIIGSIGIYATATYNARQLDDQALQQASELAVQRVQTVERFFPHLSSEKDNVRKAALETIAVLGDEQLAIKLAAHFGGEGATAVLAKLSTSKNPEIAKNASEALTQQFDRLHGSVAVIRAGKAQSTAFFVSSDGFALVPSFALQGDEITVELPSGGSVYSAVVFHRDDKAHLALLKVNLKEPVVPIETSNVTPKLEDRALLLAFAAGNRWVSVAGRVVGFVDSPSGMSLIATDIDSEPGFAGAPVVDKSGKLLGIAESRDASGKSLIIPASRVLDFVKEARRLTRR